MKKMMTGLVAGAAAGLVAGGAAALLAGGCGKRGRGVRTMKSAARKALRGAETMLGDVLCMCR